MADRQGHQEEVDVEGVQSVGRATVVGDTCMDLVTWGIASRHTTRNISRMDAYGEPTNVHNILAIQAFVQEEAHGDQAVLLTEGPSADWTFPQASR